MSIACDVVPPELTTALLLSACVAILSVAVHDVIGFTMVGVAAVVVLGVTVPSPPTDLAGKRHPSSPLVASHAPHSPPALDTSQSATDAMLP